MGAARAAWAVMTHLCTTAATGAGAGGGAGGGSPLRAAPGRPPTVLPPPAFANGQLCRPRRRRRAAAFVAGISAVSAPPACHLPPPRALTVSAAPVSGCWAAGRGLLSAPAQRQPITIFGYRLMQRLALTVV